MEKWRLYAYLRGKWFGDIVSDQSHAMRDLNTIAISGKKSEFIRIKKIEADKAWMAYSDAVFANENIQQSLAKLESFLPDNWEWKTNPPSVDEASQSLDSIKYSYPDDYVSQFGKDKSYVIIGGMGNDTLIGGYENDIIIGATGANTLKGCGGKDIFVVTDKDTVVDFNESDNDIIDISHLLNSTDKPINNYIHFELVNDPVTSEVHTLLKINTNGTGETFDDASILLQNVTFRDRIDINRLWASGNIHCAGAKPELYVSLTITDNEASEIPENKAEIELSFSDDRLPKDLTIPFIFDGTAIIGQDFNLQVPVWNEALNAYKPMTTTESIIPIRLKPGDKKIGIQLIPIADHTAEPVESIMISLLKKEDYYQLKRSTNPIIEISDGQDEISIQTTQPIAYEGKSNGATIVISRNGSLDINKEVNILIKGTAENGRDCHYIPSEMTFAPGDTQSTLSIVAYKDKEDEDVEFVEIIVTSGDYRVKGPASARVEIRDPVINSIKGDMDSNNQIDLKDAILALQICSGKNIASIAETSITNDRIGLEDVLYILKQVGK